ncbi:unnamed protein product [Knipowitschia caucasica]|uniref:G-protein coupled receptors family 1 profile domain-containing protein n=1 Tax=Knipowitschia caucasica TaxID=637954 RepID=A0AAV2J554_KNICA
MAQMQSNGSDLVLVLESLTLPPSQTLPVVLVLLFIFVFLVLSNGTMIVLIAGTRSLHQPMYLLYMNLSLCDVLYSSTVIPRLLWDLLRPLSARHIHLYSCVIQAFFVNLFASSCHTLYMVMAIDRYIAICCPLRYAGIMSGRTVLRMAVGAWTASFVLVAVLLGPTVRLTRCRSLVVGLSCSNAGLFKLSCQNTFVNNVFGMLFTVLLLGGSIGTVLLSYGKITVVCVKSRNASLNHKALQTVSTHLSAYSLFLGSSLLIIVLHRFPHLGQERMYISVVHHVVSGAINPLIYGLRSHDIRRQLRTLLRKEP